MPARALRRCLRRAALPGATAARAAAALAAAGGLVLAAAAPASAQTRPVSPGPVSPVPVSPRSAAPQVLSADTLSLVPDAAARRALRPAALALLRRAPAPAATRRVGAARVDARGRVRADYRLAAAPLPAPPARPGLSPTEAARAVLAANAARYGLDPALASLRLDTLVDGPYGATVRFAQVARLASGEGLSVAGRGASVTLGADGQAHLVTVNTEAVGQAVPAFALSPEGAAVRVRDAVLAAPGTVRVVERAAFVGADAVVRPAYVVDARAEGTLGAWRAVVDGATGDLLHLSERSVGHRDASHRDASHRDAGHRDAGHRDASHRDAGHRSGDARAAAWLRERAVAGPRRETASAPGPGADARGRGGLQNGVRAGVVDGSGLAFVPDPLTSAGVAYGAPGFVDGGDADTPELLAQRRTVPLPEIGLVGGRYVLVGPYVEVTGEALAGGIASVVPAETSPSAFRYARSDPRFESVMAYHHIDASQRYIQALGVGRPVRARPVRVSPRGTTDDDSRYLLDQNLLVFGTGGIDDAEDADVLWHEYGHAVLDDQTPGLFESFEARALHEGWSDYWAAAGSRRLVADGTVPAHDTRRVYTWDGNVGCWQGRRLDHPGVYSPTDRSRMGYPGRAGCPPPSTLYQWGLLWGTTLADAQDRVGPAAMDRIVVASLSMLAGAAGPFPAAPPMEVAAEALLAADRLLNGGANEAALVAVLAARGFVDAARFGPVLAHTPLASTEQSGGTRRIAVTATSTTSAVAAVRVVWRVNGGAEQTLALAPAGADTWAGDLPLPVGAAAIAYRIEADDAAGRTTRLPVAGAFAFASGPDATAPRLVHVPRPGVARGAFPLVLTATATDALGVADVRAEWRHERGAAVLGSGTAVLAPSATPPAAADTVFRGTLPLRPADVQPGDVVVYTLVARDRAATANAATSGPHRTTVLAGGVLLSLGAEADEGVVLTGAWRRAAPPAGVTARAGASVYTTGAGGDYPATAGTSALTLPALDLAPADGGAGGATLAVSYRMAAERGAACRTACDGGQAQVSTDGGATWSRLALAAAPGLPVPDADTLAVAPATGDRLDGPRVVSGSTPAWQRVTARLPAAPSVRVRFVFATDGSNVYRPAGGFQGWTLDSLVVSSGEPPRPPAPALAAVDIPAAAAPGTPLALGATLSTDDGALARVLVAVRRAGQTVGRDSVTLVQAAEAPGAPRGPFLRRFAATFVPEARPGDSLALIVRVTDTAGQIAERRLAIAVRTLGGSDALGGAVASGLWQTYDGVWVATDLGDGAAAPATSALVLPPRVLPANADAVRLVLRQRLVLGAGTGATVEASTDDGATWTALVPTRGYPATLDAPGHPMHRAGVLAGRDTADAVFDLTGLRGQTVRLRLRLGAARRLAPGEFWEVREARVEQATPDAAFAPPSAFAVSRPFPNPFAGRLAFAVTLAEAAPVAADLVDALGRRVAVLAGGEVREAGTHALAADLPELAAGVYVLVVRAGRERWTGTVVRR